MVLCAKSGHAVTSPGALPLFSGNDPGTQLQTEHAGNMDFIEVDSFSVVSTKLRMSREVLNLNMLTMMTWDGATCSTTF